MNKNNLAEAIFKYYVIHNITLNTHEKEILNLINQFSEEQIFEVLDNYFNTIDDIYPEDILYYLVVFNNPIHEDLEIFVDDYDFSKVEDMYYYDLFLYDFPDEDIKIPNTYKLFNNIIVNIKFYN